MNETKETKSINYFILIFRIISIIIIIVCLCILYLWDKDNRKNNSIQENLSNTYITIEENTENDSSFSPTYTNAVDENGISIEQFSIDYDSLIEQNSDSIGWVRILDTNINYPIVQTDNNNFYLDHNFEKQKNGAGWIYADYRNNFERLDKNTIIYGHNRRNGTMFSNLQYYLDEDFCSNPNHHFFNINLNYKRYLAEVFSIYKISSSKVDLPNSFITITDLENTISDWKEKSVYDFNVDVKTSDNLLSLYTCDDNTSYRIILHARLLPLY